MILKNVLLCCCCLWGWTVMAQKKKPLPPVQVRVEVTKESSDRNLILYDPARQLTIADFRGRPDMASHGVGATYSGILMEMEGTEQGGVLEIRVRLTVYFDKTKSWMKAEGRNQRVLDHEQHHFNLTAVKACDLARAIAAGQYTFQNVQSRIRDLQRSHVAELGRLQQEYDRETRHGTRPEQQAAWAERIAGLLSDAGCS